MVNKWKISAMLTEYFRDENNKRLNPATDFDIDDDGLITMKNGCVGHRQIARGVLPFKFSDAHMDFSVDRMKLKSLEGCPMYVSGDFICSHNLLTSLQGAPLEASNLDCSHNLLTSLEGCTPDCFEIVCNNNLLTSLETCPPTEQLWATDNPFQHFRNTPSHIDEVTITWRKDLPLLGLLTVKTIHIQNPADKESMEDLEQIMNKYAGQGRRAMFACQKDLEDAGFRDNARW